MTQTTELQNRPVIFIHGAWHGAWCWDQWLALFKQSGFEHVIAIELRGHGYKTGAYKHARLKDYVEDVKTIISQYDVGPVLVGHSLGCSIIQELLLDDAYPAAVLLAPIPETRLFRGVFMKQLFTHPVISLRSICRLSMGPWVTSKKSPQLFFSDYMPIRESMGYIDRMQGESFRLFMLDLMRSTKESSHKTPTLVVAAQNDSFFSVKVQRTTASDLAADFFVSRNAGHDIMLDVSSEETAREVINWLNTNTST